MTAAPTQNRPNASFSYRDRRYMVFHNNPKDHIFAVIRDSHAFYEHEFLEALSAYIKPGELVLDVGANIGNHTLFFAGACGARVLAFEPNPRAADLLRANIEANELEELVRVEEVALGASERLGAIENIGGENNLGAAKVKIDDEGEITIRRLDAMELPDRPALIKVDVEGMDLEVLKGAESTLRKHMPIIAVEAADRATFLEIAGFLEGLGYAHLETHNYTPTHIFEPVGGTVRKAFLTRLSREMGLNAIDLATLRSKSDQQLSRLFAKIDTLERTHGEFAADLARIQSESGDGTLNEVSAAITEALLALKSEVGDLRRSLMELWSDADSKQAQRLTQPLLRAELADTLSQLDLQVTGRADQLRLVVERQVTEATQILAEHIRKEAAASRDQLSSRVDALEDAQRRETLRQSEALNAFTRAQSEQAKRLETRASADAAEVRERVEELSQSLTNQFQNEAAAKRAYIEALSAAQNELLLAEVGTVRVRIDAMAEWARESARDQHKLHAELATQLAVFAQQAAARGKELDSAVAQIRSDQEALRGETRMLVAAQNEAREGVRRAERSANAAVEASLALGGWLQHELAALRSDIVEEIRKRVVSDLKDAIVDAVRQESRDLARILGEQSADVVLQLASSMNSPDTMRPRREFFDAPGFDLPRAMPARRGRVENWRSSAATAGLDVGKPALVVVQSEPSDDADGHLDRSLKGALRHHSDDARVTSLARLNESYFSRVRDAEIPFLTDYFFAVARLELPDTSYRLGRYLMCHFDEVPAGRRAQLVQLLARWDALRPSDDVLARAISRFRAEIESTGAPPEVMQVLFRHLPEAGPRLDARAVATPSVEPKALNSRDALLVPLSKGAADETMRKRHWNAYLEQFSRVRIERILSHGGFLASVRFQPLPRTDGPQVSILMSAFNAEQTITYAVESLLGQSYANLEVLVCDDESSDGTLRALNAFRGDERVRVFRSLRNQGTYNIRNALLERARGEFVAFLDSDDFALPDRIETQIAQIEAADASFGHLLRVDHVGRPQMFYNQTFERFSVLSILYRRDALHRVGRYLPVQVGADTAHYEHARFVLGADAFAPSLPRPLLFALAAENSLTSTPGLEARLDGATSLKRQWLMDLASKQRLLGSEIIPHSNLVEHLQHMEVYREPAGIEELGGAA